MRATGAKRIWLGALCAATLALGAGAAPAQGAASDPLFVFRASQNPQPGGEFNGPCGLAVDIAGNFYVSDYYHHAVDVYSPSHAYITQAREVGPLDGPCGTAIDSTGKLYVNDFHRSVVRYTPSTFPPNGSTTYGAATVIDSAHPTGVAVDANTGKVYVNGRTHVSVYDSAGVLFSEIGAGNLTNGYGVAFSQFAGTFGNLYVPDAATDTVKVFESSTGAALPSIAGPPGGFVSLVDSAVAVDRVSGEVYVADRTGSRFAERPEATIHVFTSTGAYKGHLKYNVVDAAPVGLAVDNSAGASQGRVYVTSGNTTQASVYAYPPGAATGATPLPATATLSVSTSGSGSGLVAGEALGLECAGSCVTGALVGAEVALSATPDPGSTFAGWSGGGCEGVGECVVAMEEATSLVARFEALSGPPAAAAAVGPVTAQTSAAASAAHRHRARHRDRRRHHRPKALGRHRVGKHRELSGRQR
jgi:hypothetical protein